MHRVEWNRAADIETPADSLIFRDLPPPTDPQQTYRGGRKNFWRTGRLSLSLSLRYSTASRNYRPSSTRVNPVKEIKDSAMPFFFQLYDKQL